MTKFRLIYSAPHGYKMKDSFQQVCVKDFHYCKSHKFWFNPDYHEELLYNGKPCIYTDNRYIEGANFYGEGGFFVRKKSLKSCIRKLRKSYNLPEGTTATFLSSYIGRTKKGKRFSFSVEAVITKENKYDFDFEINMPCYTALFSNDDKANDLIKKMRAAGFIVAVHANVDFIAGPNHPEEIAVAYGFNKTIGFSANKNSFRGYGIGIENVLYDYFQEFNKWSQANEISKEKSNDEILEILMKPKQK